MPKIRYIYGPDIKEHGSEPVEVYDVEARVLTADRRAVLVDDPAELAELAKPELLKHAREVGADVSARAPKAEIIEAIQDAQAD